MSDRGHPRLILRIHPDALKQLEKLAGRHSRGKKSGVSAYVRGLIYQHLGFSSGEHEGVADAQED